MPKTKKCPYCGAGFKGTVVSSTHISKCKRRALKNLGPRKAGSPEWHDIDKGKKVHVPTPEKSKQAQETYNNMYESFTSEMNKNK